MGPLDPTVRSLGPTVDPEVRFPSLRKEAIVFEDAQLIAIDKPTFVPTQPARGDDDLPTRVRRFLTRRDGSDVALGVHQRLDALTSGVVVYAKAPAANAELAKAFESRTVEKRYLAVVHGRGPLPEGRLEDYLLHDHGITTVDRRGEAASSTVQVLERDGARALLEVSLETGRSHQIRVQLASRGFPIVGDPLYGGAPDARLMLHAASLTLPGREPMVAPRPSAFDRALRGDAIDPLRNLEVLRERLTAACERRYRLGHLSDTNAFRLVHAESDGLPGLAVDVYGDHLVAHLYREDLDEARIFDALMELGFAGVYVKRRPQQANELGDEGARARAPSDPVRGEPALFEGTVLEHGVPYSVRLGDGLSTGLFLDQRAERHRLEGHFLQHPGGQLLNLFAYTCGFSIAAAKAGAKTTSVDASKSALDRGRAGLALIGADPKQHRLFHDDAFDVLARLGRRGERFEVIVCDPPTYSKTKKTRFTSSREQWVELFAQCLAVLAPGGLLYATSNDQRVNQRAFAAMAKDGAKRAGVALSQCKDVTAQEDFPARFDGSLHLKGVLATRV